MTKQTKPHEQSAAKVAAGPEQPPHIPDAPDEPRVERDDLPLVPFSQPQDGAPTSPGRDPNFKADLPSTIDPEAMYEVRLWRAVKWRGSDYRPDQKITLSGAALEEMKDSVLAAAKAP